MKKKYKIWVQGATDRKFMLPYISRVEAHLKDILDPAFSFTFNSTTPPATTTHALTEYRIGAAFVRGAVKAEKQGYDGMMITHFQDAALAEVKSVAKIPVLGLGETTLFHALTLGRKIGLVTINPTFIPWHEDQVIRYRIQDRVVGVRAVNAQVADWINAFADKNAYKKLKPKWERECRSLLDAGADVIVPAGGLPMMMFGGQIDGAPVVNGVTLLAKSTEMAIKLREKAGMFTVSRRSNYVHPPEKALKEFLEAGMKQTLAQKLVARAAGRSSVTPGEIVTCKVDLAMVHDSSGPRRLKPMLDRLKAKVWDPSKVVVITDHYLPAYDDESRNIIRIAREWVKEAGVENFYDAQGICHIVLPERGHLSPGMFAVGGDSHSPTGGAFAAYMFGIGATEMLGVMVTGEIWLKVPHTILMDFSGKISPGVSAKDIMLFLIGRFGLDGGKYQAVEYRGDAIRALPMQERMTLCNMTAELGGQTGLIASDDVTRSFLNRDIETWNSDSDAAVLEHHRFNAGDLAPQVAAPHSPGNTKSVEEFLGTRLDLAYIGACTGAKLVDLRMAAQIFKGRKAKVRLLLAPASLRDQQAAEKEGTLQVLLDAGAELLANSCGMCAGYGEHVLAENTVAISTTARNFKGRMGAATAQVYLASPYTVAASAIAGSIADPRELLA